MKALISRISSPEWVHSPEAIRSGAVILALLLTLAAPFVLRPTKAGYTKKPDQTLVILTPHNETIRAEFSRAFFDHMLDQDGVRVRIDWRTPGGTTEIGRLIASSYRAAFQNHWTGTLGQKWDDSAVGDAFNNRFTELGDGSPGAEARNAFLQSDVGIGADLFFGGGEYPFVRQAEAGHLVDSGIFDKQADWFRDEIIPAEVSGERFYDPEHRWIGSCLSSFGIVYNVDSLKRLGFEEPPRQWADLGRPEFFRQLALADPSKSGSTTKAFEMLIQQQMNLARQTVKPRNEFEEPEMTELRAVRQGWLEGLNLIQRISGNARYFTDSSGKIPLDVSQGNSAVGMCIDYYGRTASELVQREDGSSRVGFITPMGGSSVSVDPIAMLRGAPEPELALSFIEFVLSSKGQQLWNYRRGEEGGPVKRGLRRMPLRKDLYTEEHLARFADPGAKPYQAALEFQYVREWTEPAFRSIQFIIRCMCLDSHEELQETWATLIENDFPEAATRTFFDVGFVSYDKALSDIKDAVDSGYKLKEVRLLRDLTNQFRSNYRRAAQMAERGL